MSHEDAQHAAPTFCKFVEFCACTELIINGICMELVVHTHACYLDLKSLPNILYKLDNNLHYRPYCSAAIFKRFLAVVSNALLLIL